MANGRAFDLLLLLRRVIERVTQEHVSVAAVTGVSRDDRIESFGESNLLHEVGSMIRAARLSGNCAAATFAFRTPIRLRRDRRRCGRADAMRARRQARPLSCNRGTVHSTLAIAWLQTNSCNRRSHSCAVRAVRASRGALPDARVGALPSRA